MTALPYYFVRRLPTGRWCVAHRVPCTGIDHVDADCATLAAAQRLAALMEQHRECGWQIRHVSKAVEWFSVYGMHYHSKGKYSATKAPRQ